MAIIAIQFGSIKGECTINGCDDHVDAVGIRESVESNIGSAARGAGRGRASDIELVRYKDSASPKLIQACSAAENLGETVIRLFQTIESGNAIFMQYKLEATYISRIEQITLDEGNYGFQPQLMSVTRGLPTPGTIGLSSTLAPVVSAAAANSRLVPIGTGPLGNGFSNRELERVFLNANSVTWTYTPYKNGVAGGAVERGFNLRTGTPI